MINQIRKYIAKGYSVFPVKQDKRPYFSWEEYQHRKPTRDELNAWWGPKGKYQKSNVAIVTGAISNLTVVDIDSKEGEKAIEKYVPMKIQTPVVMTPSGGYHIYFQHEEQVRNKARFLTDCDIRSEGGYVVAPPSENGNGNAYSFVRENELKALRMPTSLLFLLLASTPYYNNIYNIAKDMPNVFSSDDKRIRVTTTDYKIEDGKRDDTLFHIANCLTKGQTSEDEICEILTIIGLHGCQTPFPLKEIKQKIESSLKRQKNINRAWMEEVRQLLMNTKGDITTTAIHQWLQAATRREKQSINQALARLADEGLLKRSETKAGQYRIISKNVKFKDWKKARSETLDFVLPMGMHEAVKIRPGSVILIAGQNNSGKTAFAMEITALNCHSFDTYYFSSEIEEEEFKERAESYGGLENWKCDFASDWDPSSIGDIILPDALNIIDYLEPPGGDYTQMAVKLTEIHHTLNKGVAVVCLQKKGDSEFGAGGEYMANKPQFYCTLDKVNYPVCRLHIRKCKAPKKGYINPSGLSVDYKIARDGVHIRPYGKFDFKKWDE